MKILCLKHIPFEGPAALNHWAKLQKHNIQTIEVYQGNPLPEQLDFDLLLVLGGPMNIYQHEAHPWLEAEKAFIHRVIDSGKKVVGICLGAQLIADVLGAKVTHGETTEIGWFDIERSPDCPESLALPESLRVFHWHGDTFEIPEGAQRIASSEGCLNQGFLFEDRVLGLQCHLETTPESLDALASACGDEISEGPYMMPVEQMKAEPDATYAAMHHVLFEMLDALR